MLTAEPQLELSILTKDDKSKQRKTAKLLLVSLFAATAIVIRVLGQTPIHNDKTSIYIMSAAIFIFCVTAPILIYYCFKTPSRGSLILLPTQIIIKQKRLKIVIPINQMKQICISQSAASSVNSEECNLNFCFEYESLKQNIAIEELFAAEKKTMLALVQMWQKGGTQVSCDL